MEGTVSEQKKNM